MLRLGIDTGGTFTDVVAYDEQSGKQWATKVASTPADPSQAFMHGVHGILRIADRPVRDVSGVAHGTTMATNALLRDEFPGLGLIVTRGFKHLLEIARQSVPQGYGNSYFWVKPARIVPLHLVREVGERLDFRGEVLEPFDEHEASQAAAWFRDRDIDCIGVCFLHAYANGEHERRMRNILARVHPSASVSISSEVLPEYREYERAVTTLVDAFVKPRVGAYIARIEQQLRTDVSPTAPFHIMKSNGGVASAAEIGRQPIGTLLSGPAAGALGAALLASTAGFGRVLTLDGGGTSTDVAVIDDGTPHLTTEARVGAYPVKVPMIDVVTVGAGGGSIARRAVDGRLKVGPDSAGAEPGPMCYARGGCSPTVTDAAVVLGRLPTALLAGEIALDVGLAERGIGELAAVMGMDTPRTAAGVLEIAAWNQANAVRQITVKRGLDVRDYVLVAFGGSGPLQAGRLIDILGLHSALVPPDPGNVSAFGLLAVDVKHDYVTTAVQRDDVLDLALLTEVYALLERKARDALAAEGFPPPLGQLVRSADLRYFGQAWEVNVEVPAGPIDRQSANLAVARFHTAHHTTYGYSYANSPEQRVEWVNYRVIAIGAVERPAVRPRARSLSGGVERACVGRRRVYFDAAFWPTAVFARQSLQPGDLVEGPAIVEEYGSTTVVPPRQGAAVDPYGNLILRRIA